MFRVDMLGDAASCVELVPRLLPFGAFNLSAAGMCEQVTFNKLFDDLHQYASDALGEPNPIGFRDRMMQAVRDTATLVPDSVGPHVVGVILNPQDKKISTVFSPADPTGEPPTAHEIHENFAGLAKIPTPWLLRPGMSHAPSVGNPGGWVGSSGITFEFSGFDSDDPGPGGGYFGSQPCKGPPR